MEARKNKTQTGVLEVRGPNGYVMLVCYTTDNAKSFAMELNSKIKKTKYEYYSNVFSIYKYVFNMYLKHVIHSIIISACLKNKILLYYIIVSVFSKNCMQFFCIQIL